MHKCILGISKHSRAFRRMMILELRPVQVQIRNYSESASSEKQPPPISRFEATKHYIKQVHIEGSDEANTVLGYLRRAGALSVLVMFASIGYAVYVEKSNKPKEIEEIEIEEYMPKLGEDVRYANK